jgi:hypothetical protein
MRQPRGKEALPLAGELRPIVQHTGWRCPCSPAKRASTRTARAPGRAWQQGLLPESRRPLAPVPPLVVGLLPFLAQRHVRGAVPVAGLLRSQPAGTLLPHSCRCLSWRTAARLPAGVTPFSHPLREGLVVRGELSHPALEGAFSRSRLLSGGFTRLAGARGWGGGCC